MKISLTNPTIDETDIAAMEIAVRKKSISQSEEVTQLEDRFAAFLEGAGAIAVNSGTSALILALRTLGVKPGSEVILPSYTCLALLNAVTQVGGTPVLVDNTYHVDAMNFNMSIDDVKENLSSKTAAIIVPHMFGVPVEIDRIIAMGVPVIEDITHSLGGYYKNRPMGAWGHLSISSLHASKMIASGEGGILISNSGQLYDRARYLNGWESEQASLRLQAGNLPKYEIRYNFHMNGIAAALGLSQFNKIQDFVEKRRELAVRYTERLSQISRIKCPRVNSSNIFYRYLVSVENSEVITIIKKFTEAEIEAGRGVYPALHNYLGKLPEDFPGAERALKTLVSIPLFPSLSEEEVEYLMQVCERVFQEL
jgi:dTDP-4-amino-4,6-dideoxygalactose transaminase